MPEDVRDQVRAKAPAKVNLFLGVGEVRDDGYHELRTVYQSVDLWETVTLTAADADSVSVDGPGNRGSGGSDGRGSDGRVSGGRVSGDLTADVPTDASNLAMRAVDLIRVEARCEQPVAVHIEKQIPVAGGMAGGSADAAAALLAANQLFGLGLGREQLEQRAATLGSDVPFCLRGGTVIGTGRGEHLVPMLHGRMRLSYVVATAEGGLSTPEVFGELDRLRAEGSPAQGSPARRGDLDALTRAISGGDEQGFARAVGNDLQAAALSLRPDLHATLRALDRTGALVSMVSGSGPTCFGAFPDRSAALEAAASLAETGVARELFVIHGPTGGAHLVEQTDPAASASPAFPRHDRS